MGSFFQTSPQEDHTKSSSSIGNEQNALVYYLAQHFGGPDFNGGQIGQKPPEYDQLASLLGNADANFNTQAGNYYRDALLGPSMKVFNETTRPAIASAFAGYGGTLSSKRGQAIAKGYGDVTANAQSGLAQILPQLFQANTQRLGTQIQGYNSLYQLGQAPTNQVSQFAFNPTYGASRAGDPQSNGMAGLIGMLAPLAIGALSDEREKEDIKPIQGALKKVLSLKGKEFKYKDSSVPGAIPGRQVGLMAQDLEQAFPSMVVNGNDGRKRVTMRGFEGVMVEALRELSDKVDQLEGAKS